MSFDPANAALVAAFHSRYPLLPAVPLFGPYSGNLDNSGGTVSLYKPDVPDLGIVPYILVDEVGYKDSAPWPVAADGAGASLVRLQASRYGNEPTNWTCAAPLTIIAQPLSTVGRPGTNAVFSVAALGNGPLSYQWRFNGADIANATSAILSIPNAQTNHQGSYSVLMTDASGSAESAAASLTILVNPTIVQHPQSVSAFVGDTVTFSVKVTGTEPLAYRWRYTATNGQVRQVANFGQGIATLTITNVQFTNAGSYVVSVTNAGLALNVTSNSLPALLMVFADNDGDRMADIWETAHGLDPNANDAAGDPDLDGMTNLQEYLAGTDPQSRQSALQLFADPLPSGGGAIVRFFAVSNKNYTVLYSDSPGGGSWFRLSDVGTAPTNRTIRLTNAPPAVPRRYYRLTTPMLP